MHWTTGSRPLRGARTNEVDNKLRTQTFAFGALASTARRASCTREFSLTRLGILVSRFSSRCKCVVELREQDTFKPILSQVQSYSPE